MSQLVFVNFLVPFGIPIIIVVGADRFFMYVKQYFPGELTHPHIFIFNGQPEVNYTQRVLLILIQGPEDKTIWEGKYLPMVAKSILFIVHVDYRPSICNGHFSVSGDYWQSLNIYNLSVAKKGKGRRFGR